METSGTTSGYMLGHPFTSEEGSSSLSSLSGVVSDGLLKRLKRHWKIVLLIEGYKFILIILSMGDSERSKTLSVRTISREVQDWRSSMTPQRLHARLRLVGDDIV